MRANGDTQNDTEYAAPIKLEVEMRVKYRAIAEMISTAHVSIYYLWPNTGDNLESAERYAAGCLRNGWEYTSSLAMPDYDAEDFGL